MDNPDTLARSNKQDEDKQNKKQKTLSWYNGKAVATTNIGEVKVVK
jgi:hypothetical protein